MDQMILEKLFESVPKIRLLRIFMRNPDTLFTLKELIQRSQMKERALKKELAKFLKLELFLQKKQTEEDDSKKTSKKKKKQITVFCVNQNFPIFEELRNLIIKSSLTSKEKVLERLKGIGRMQLVVLSGVFLHNEHSRTDLLIVGDRINRRRFDSFLQHTESEIGRTLRYTIMDTAEFRYRRDMYDRFLRDILEFPHEKLINRINI